MKKENEIILTGLKRAVGEYQDDRYGKNPKNEKMLTVVRDCGIIRTVPKDAVLSGTEINIVRWAMIHCLAEGVDMPMVTMKAVRQWAKEVCLTWQATHPTVSAADAWLDEDSTLAEDEALEDEGEIKPDEEEPDDESGEEEDS